MSIDKPMSFRHHETVNICLACGRFLTNENPTHFCTILCEDAYNTMVENGRRHAPKKQGPRTKRVYIKGVSERVPKWRKKKGAEERYNVTVTGILRGKNYRVHPKDPGRNVLWLTLVIDGMLYRAITEENVSTLYQTQYGATVTVVAIKLYEVEEY